MSDVSVRIESLHVYPIKSCAGLAPSDALLTETGLDLDRAWMVVDENREFVTQREHPRMALIRPALRHSDVVVRAPGMLALHLSLEAVEEPLRVRVWNDEVAAYDMGELAAQWFSDFIGRRVRLVRFDPEQRRLSDPAWTGALQAENAFADGFPLLVTSSAAHAELNRRLAGGGQAAVEPARMRPNLVLAGLDAHGEDHLDDIVFDAAGAPVRLRLVKPCARCTIPDVDPATGEQGHAVVDAMVGYRADQRVGGKLTFGMNAVIVEGCGATLRVGMEGGATYKFD